MERLHEALKTICGPKAGWHNDEGHPLTIGGAFLLFVITIKQVCPEWEVQSSKIKINNLGDFADDPFLGRAGLQMDETVLRALCGFFREIARNKYNGNCSVDEVSLCDGVKTDDSTIKLVHHGVRALRNWEPRIRAKFADALRATAALGSIR